ncbi:hypothetical protein CS022_13680 [Veronia nyctiphanis]|uniref:Uncharacterized protein n=1 Tax=Veronia nyctiphanis TaxID=1278244 RepID=A0A4V1LSS2_9GAMM|nr:SDR family NAD(P)-dependent oxidoreductase [Veronia nyctiphanis]RXJ72688.1 hypothetical protein CS022_13680 [Veronia nyctiphanis]
MPSILITGAGKGLGNELAKIFSSNGWQLYLVVRTIESAKNISQEIETAKVFISDITSEDYESQLQKWLEGDTIDVVINNAGAGSKEPDIHSATAEQLKTVFDTNCIGVFSTIKGAYSSLQKAENGLVINISSRRGSLSMQSSGAAKVVVALTHTVLVRPPKTY